MNNNRAIQRRQPTVPSREVREYRGYVTDEPEAAALPQYWQILKNRRVIVLGTLAIVFVAVLIGTIFQKPVYRATGLLEIRKENQEVTSLETLFKLGDVTDEYLQTQFGILKSTALAHRVIDRLQLHKVREFNPDAAAVTNSESPSPSLASQAALKRFQERLILEPMKGSRLVSVSFESHDPNLAARVVNAIFSTFVQMRQEMGQKTTKWLGQELQTARAKLEEAEAKLQQYARDNGLLFLEGSQGGPENLLNERLRRMQDELTQAQAARYSTEALHEQVRRGNFDALPGVADNQVIQSLIVRLAELRREHALLSTSFHPAYPRVVQTQQQIKEIESQLNSERQRAIQRIRNDHQAALRREALLNGAFATQQKNIAALSEKSSMYNILKRDVDTQRQLYTTLQQKSKEVDVAESLKANNVGVVDSAAVPLSPDRPKWMLNLALGLLVGMALGVGGAFIREAMDTTIKSAEEVERFFDVGALGLIPSARIEAAQRRVVVGNGHSVRRLPASNGHRSPMWYRIDGDIKCYSPLAEAFGALRTSVLLSTKDSLRSLLITSSQPGEGKTTVSCNLALSIAQLGRHVLLIDADIRRPCLHRALSLDNRQGLVDYLGENVAWRELVQTMPNIPLSVITSGPYSSHPADLLSSDRLKVLLQEAASEYDYVLLDSPALFINAADARIVAPLVQGVVLVVRCGATPRDVINRALSGVENVVGVILNDLNPNLLPDYYRNYYGHQEVTS